MKNILIVALISLSSSLFAQQKREILLDENGKSITEEEFKYKISPPDYKYTYYRTLSLPDSIIQNRLVLREVVGNINEADKLKVINALKEITGSEIDLGKTIIIYFFFKDTGHNEADVAESFILNRKLKRFISRNKHCSHFFISEEGFPYKNEILNEDVHNIIRDTLFVLPFASTYLIIRPNGEYYKCISEFSFKTIRKTIKGEWKI